MPPLGRSPCYAPGSVTRPRWEPLACLKASERWNPCTDSVCVWPFPSCVVSYQVLLDTKPDHEAAARMRNAAALRALGDAFTDDVPGESVHHALDPRLRPGPMLRLVYQKEFSVWHSLESSIPAHVVRESAPLWLGKDAGVTMGSAPRTSNRSYMRFQVKILILWPSQATGGRLMGAILSVESCRFFKRWPLCVSQDKQGFAAPAMHVMA